MRKLHINYTYYISDGPLAKKAKKSKAPVSIETCQECQNNDGDGDDWIGCDHCGAWYHKWCIEDTNVLLMPEEALREFNFHCKICNQ